MKTMIVSLSLTALILAGMQEPKLVYVYIAGAACTAAVGIYLIVTKTEVSQ